MIVVGGTGLLPFGDLIDLLFKEEYASNNPDFRKGFLELSPILASPFLEKNSFHLMGSFGSIEDIHKLTLLQLIYLQQRSKRFSVSVKLGNGVSE